MKMEKYLRAVRRKLNMPRELKDRIITDFRSSIQARKEDGQSEADIMVEFGSPKQAAKELNEQMKEYTYQKSPWRWACLGLAVLSGLCLAYRGLPGLLLMLFNKVNNAASVGIIGGADGPTAIFVTTATSTTSDLFTFLLLAMGVIGFLALRKLPKK